MHERSMAKKHLHLYRVKSRNYAFRGTWRELLKWARMNFLYAHESHLDKPWIDVEAWGLIYGDVLCVVHKHLRSSTAS